MGSQPIRLELIVTVATLVLPDVYRATEGDEVVGYVQLAGPVYVVAGLSAVTRRELAYAVTAKGALRTVESLATFRAHLVFAALSASALLLSLVLEHDAWWLRFWACLTLVIGVTPPLTGLPSLCQRSPIGR